MKVERIAGRIPVLECLRAAKRTACRLFVLHGGRGLDAIREAARGVPIEECARKELDAMVQGGVHQGVVLEATPLPIRKFDTWCEEDFSADAVVVLLDGVEDPHNFGAIVRSAAACGACAVIFGKRHAAPVSPASVKSAAGAMEHIDLVQATNLTRAIQSLQKNGFWAAELAPEGQQLLWQTDLTGRIILVVGAEGKGVRRLVGKNCDLHMRIPLTGAITSLNASVSAAIALAECLRQRTSQTT